MVINNIVIHSTTAQKSTLTCDQGPLLIFFLQTGEENKLKRTHNTSHLLLLRFLRSVNRDVILFHAINVSQLDFTGLIICCIQMYLSLGPAPGFVFEIALEVKHRKILCVTTPVW